MTKRMLSLLLALVMTLSLCVPALAAGDFAAEAVTDVEEQAPVAPVALEPEAEVVAEPAADEAVVAAITVDEPVEAAITGDKLQATEADYKLLHAAIDTYAKKYEQAKNGELWGAGWTFEKWLQGKTDEALQDFITDYEAALKLDAEFAGYPWPDQDEVQALYNGLPDEADHVYGPMYPVTADFYTGGGYPGFSAVFDRMWDIAVNNPDTFEDNLQPGWFAKVESLYYRMVAIWEENGGVHKATYLPYKDIVDCLTVALKGEKLYYALNGYEHEYVDGYGLNMGLKDLGVAVKPLVADGDAMRAARNALKDAIDKAATRWGHNGAPDGNYKAATDLLNGLDLYVLNKDKGNGLYDYVTLEDVNKLIEDAEVLAGKLVADTRSTRITSWVIDPNNKDILYVVVELPDGALDDGHYFLRVQLDGSQKDFDLEKWGPADDIGIEDPGIGKDWRYWARVTKSDILTKDPDPFDDDDVLTVSLRDADGNVYQTVTIEIDVAKDTTPQVIGSGFAKTDNGAALDKFYLSFNANLSSTWPSWTHRIEITRPDGTTTNKAITGTLGSGNNNVYWEDGTVQVGTYTIKYYGKNGKTEMAAQTAEITVNPITSYSKYANLTKAIANADGYEKLVVNQKVTTDSDANVKAVVARYLKAATDIVAAAATTPDTAAKEAAVVKATSDLNTAMKMLTTGADQSALIAALDAAAKLVESDYTPETWKVLKAAVTAGETVKKTNISDSVKDAEAIKKAAKDINDAIAALGAVKPTAELTALQALVDSVPTRLAADDYTEASKAAVESAAAAAKALLASKTPTKSALQAAADKLQAALNALETAKGPQPPVGGTGWVKYNGLWYYFVNNVLKKNYWVTNGSQHDLWYHMGADGTLDTGFQYIEDKTFGHGWYMLQGDDSNGMLGAMLTGWQDTKIAGMGWFVDNHNGNYGDCTWTKAWGNYYPIANTWDIGGTHITK